MYSFNTWGKVCGIAAVSWHDFVVYAGPEIRNVGFILGRNLWNLFVPSMMLRFDVSSLRLGISLLFSQLPAEGAISDDAMIT